jgi:hypothetical protein
VKVTVVADSTFVVGPIKIGAVRGLATVKFPVVAGLAPALFAACTVHV